MYEGVDTVVLQNELAYQDLLPVGWRPLRTAPDLATVTSLADSNVRILQVCAAIEEQGASRRKTKNPAFRRHHAAGSQNEPAAGTGGAIACRCASTPCATLIRFNALGAYWNSTVPLRNGEQGFMEIYLRDSLPTPLTLIATITQVGAEGQVRAAFSPPWLKPWQT